MEDWQQDIITRRMPELIRVTDVSVSLLALLHVPLNDEDKQELDAVTTKIQKANMFYKKMKTKENSFDLLIAALKDNSVKSAAAGILEREKAEWERKNSSKRAPSPQLPPKTNKMAPKTDQEIIDFIKNKKPLRVNVRKPTEAMAFDDDYYKLPVEEKGLALVINITKFEKQDPRIGAKRDKVYMNDLLQGLGYRVRPHEGGFTTEEVQTIITEFREEVKQEHPASIVVFIGSHGQSDEIETFKEDETIHIFNDIVYKFKPEVCEAMDGKPKIFLISACQRFPSKPVKQVKEQRTKADDMCAGPMQDTYVLLSTTPGHLSNTDDYLGGWFTYCFTKAVMENAHEQDFYSLVKKTQDEMGNIDGVSKDGYGQICNPRIDTLKRNLYFNLKP